MQTYAGLQGARQTGKTFILDKFDRENYKKYLYINMLQTSGEQFLKCLEKATYWEPGMDHVEHPIHNAFTLLNKEFKDDKNTIIVIDEIQEFKDILEVNLFEQIFPAIAQSILKEKKGSADLITELSGIIYKDESNRVTKRSINHVIAWIYRSHIIGFCGKANDCNPITVSMNCRFYFLDLGICQYFLDKAGADLGTLRGLVSENFVYIDY